MSSWPTKDPNEVVDYEVDWTDRLETGETIVTSAFSVVTGTVVIGVTDVVGLVTSVWLSGGAVGEVSEILNRITTSGGRTWDLTTKLRIRSK